MPPRFPYERLVDQIEAATGEDRIPVLYAGALTQATDYHRQVMLHLTRAGISTGLTREEVERTIRAAIRFSAGQS